MPNAARAMLVLAPTVFAALLTGCAAEAGDPAAPERTADQPSATAAPPSTLSSVPGAGTDAAAVGGVTSTEVCELLTVAEAKKLLKEEAGASVDVVEAVPASADRVMCDYQDPEQPLPLIVIEVSEIAPGTMGTEIEVAGRTASENDIGGMCAVEVPMENNVTLKVTVQGTAELCGAARSAAKNAIERFPG